MTMKTDSKKDGECRITLAISAPAEETADTYNRVLGAHMRNSQIRGFRKGKAPKDIVLRAYGRQIDAEVESQLCRKFIDKAVEDEKLDVASIVNLADVVFSPEKGIEFTVSIDVNPAVKVPKYKGLPVKYEKPAVAEDDVERQLSGIRESFATTKESDEPLKAGDYANISFESDIPAPEKEDDPASRYIRNDNFWLQVGEKPAYEAIPGSAKALLGLKKGDAFSFDTTFPDTFSVESLRGAKGSYKGTIIKANAVVQPTDEDVCKGLGMESIDKVRDFLRSRLEADLEYRERARLHDEIDGILAKKATFDVPKSVVAAAGRAIGENVVTREIQGKIANQEEANDYVKDHVDELREKIDAEATRIVRLNYIGAAIARELDITATDKDVRALADSEAASYARRGGDSVSGDKIYDGIVKNGLVGYYRDRIRYSKVVDWIIDNDIKAAK